MVKGKGCRYGLDNIKLKTVLIYPPLFPSELPPLSIPILSGFLKDRGYKNIESIDINDICYNKLRLKKVFLLAKTFLCSWSIRKTKCANINFHFAHVAPVLSLKRMLDVVVRDLSTDKEAKKISKIILPFIVRGEPDVVGISVAYPRQIFYALLIARIIKEIRKDIFVVLGGAQVGKHVNFLVKDKALVNMVDGFIEGDGEVPLAKLICQLDRGGDLMEVPNFYFKKPDSKGGCYYVRTRYDYVYDPKEVVMPDFSGFKLNGILPVRASIGCSWGKCTFCTWTKFHKKNICSSPEGVLLLMKELIKKYKVNRFEFIDDSLNVDFLRKFSRLILKEKVRIRWRGYMHFQPELEDEAFVKSLAKAGCENICFGVESMSPRILKLMNKQQTDPEAIRRTLKLLIKHKIHVRVSMILGFPSETEEEAKRTINFLINESELYSLAIIQHFSLESDMCLLKNLDKFGISKVYDEYKISKRLGFHYKTKKGMTPEESKRLVDYTHNVLNHKGKI